MIDVPLPENASYFQVAALLVESESIEVGIDLVDPHAPERILGLRFSGVAKLNVSKRHDDDEGCYLIGKISLRKYQGSDVSNNQRLAEAFNGHTPSACYHLKIEGDLCIEILAVDFNSTA